MKTQLQKKMLSLLFLFVSIFMFTGSASAQVNNNAIKVLAIGNSFSEDATEAYLYGIAKACGKELIVGNLVIGGSSLENHRNNVNNDSKAYSYRKIVNGVKTVQANVSISEIIPDEDWDYITFQQVSQNSGMYSSFFPYLTELKDYVSARVTNSKVKYALHMTWAYAANSDHSGFANYSRSQMKMFDAIVDAVNKAAKDAKIDVVIPAGTTIQNARTSSIGDNFCTDGYHLNSKGRYGAACAWVEKLLGVSTVDCGFIPSDISASDVKIMQNAAHNAVIDPLKITLMGNPTENVEETTDADLINISFGAGASATGWNVLSAREAGKFINPLRNAGGGVTGASLTITKEFNGTNASGPTSTTTILNMPSNISSSSLFGENGITSAIEIKGLDTNKKHTFSFFAGRTGADGKIRETEYKVVGENEKIAYLDATNNSTQIAQVIDIIPTASGSVSVYMKAGPNNNVGNYYFYLGAMQILKQADLPTGIESAEKTEAIILYPNPVVDYLHIQTEKDLKKIEVLDLKGTLVASVGTKATSINLSHLSKGIYLVKLTSDDSKPEIHKVVKF